MTHHAKRLLMFVLLTFALWPPLARAEGGVVVRPYWTFRTEAPVIRVQSGDINGDGVPEVVALTANNTVYVLTTAGNIAWQQEAGLLAQNLLVANLDDDGRTAEIFVGGRGEGVLLTNTAKPAWYWRRAAVAATSIARAADLNRDGRPEIIVGGDSLVAVDPATGGNYATDWQSSDTRGLAGRPVRDLWVGDLDGDGLPDVLPSVIGGDLIYRLQDTDFDQVWQRSLGVEVGLVQAGNVIADESAEIAVLTADWQLILLTEHGDLLWQQRLLPASPWLPAPQPGQFLMHDLDGDHQAEILLLEPAPLTALVAFNGQGEPVWRHPLPAGHQSGQLLAADFTGDGQAEVVIAPNGREQLYFLDASGQRLAEYHTQGAITAVEYADLNGDGSGEIIVGTEAGVQLFGTSADVVWQQRWQSPSLGMTTVNALAQADLNNDGRSETLAGLQSGWLFALADDGRILWDVDLGGSVQTVAAADVDGDGRAEILAGSAGQGGQLYLLDKDRPRWDQRANAIGQVIAPDVDGDGQADIIVRAGTTRGLVQRFNNTGQALWQQRFEEPVTAIGSQGGQILAGTAGGRVHRLAADGRLLSVINLGAEVISIDQGLAATAAGRLFQLDKTGPPRVVQELGPAPLQALRSGNSTAVLAGGQVNLLGDNGVITPVDVAGQVTALAVGPEDVIALGSDSGKVHLFGLTLDQPPLLTDPELSETRDGYVYSVAVNDPDRDPVQVTLEAWDPSAERWLAFAPQTSHEPGRLAWAGLAPFDTWDSGAESRFRFIYGDGPASRATAEIPGPLTIPTAPWYVVYGQRLALGGAAVLAALLGWGFYRRRQTYRQSPVGRAEALLAHLRANPTGQLSRLQTVAQTEPELLDHLPGLATQAGETPLANLSEGLHLLLSRPEMTTEAVRATLSAIEQLPAQPQQQTAAALYRFYLQALEANTVSRLVALRPAQLNLSDDPPAAPPLTAIALALSELRHVIEILSNSQRVEAPADKVAYLAQAIERLGRFEVKFQDLLPRPERTIFARIALAWLNVANNALQDLQGRAQIEVTLKTRRLLLLETTTLTLELTNSGRSPASNLRVTLLPGEGYTPSNGDVRLDILPAGRSAVVALPLEDVSAVGQFRAEFVLRFDDRERAGKSLAFADVVQLLQPTAEFQPIPNPYAPGTPLALASPIFFGRDDLFQFIDENITVLPHQNILVLIGQRRMGKTSFLQQLPARLGEGHLPVYVDGQSLGIDPGMANFFYDLSLAVVDALDEAGIIVDEPAPAQFQLRPSGFFEREFLPAVFKAIGQQQLLLLFDEFEELEMRVASGKLDATIFSFLRHLMQHHRQMAFIFVGTHKLESLSADYWSIFFNIALYKHVTFLDEGAARALIMEPVAIHGLIYDDLALDKMLRVTAGHPYFLQLLCHALVNRANREQRGYVTIQDVNTILSELVELGEAHFAFLWEQSTGTERLLLAALNRLVGREPTVTAGQIGALLAGRGLALPDTELLAGLQQLVEREIVRKIEGQPTRYEFKIELVRLWVDRYKSLGRIIEGSYLV